MEMVPKIFEGGLDEYLFWEIEQDVYGAARSSIENEARIYDAMM